MFGKSQKHKNFNSESMLRHQAASCKTKILPVIQQTPEKKTRFHCTSICKKKLAVHGLLSFCLGATTQYITRRSVVERIECLLLKRYARVQFLVGSNQKL